MAEERTQRRLAAILAADVAGYGRLMEQDEAETLAALKQRRREILQPLVGEYHGRIVKVMGDGVLVEFSSAVNAVACAVELQRRMAIANDGIAAERHIILRIGINVGDVVVERGDLYGDGVIIAVRLQTMAEPGDICLAANVQEQVGNKLPLALEDIGPCEAKNISKPVRAFRIRTDHKEVARTVERQSKQNKPSIAVLPFTNMSDDREQEYFSDGITEDIITDVSQVSALFVVARHTAFTLKGKQVTAQQAARELGVRYILEGSVRKAQDRVRVSAQLIDGLTGGHLWAKRFDRDMEDIFAVQDEISRSIADALSVRLLPLGIAGRRTTDNADAYQCYLMGRWLLMFVGDKRAFTVARQMFAKAIDIDPHYAKAHAGIATTDCFLMLTSDPTVSFESIFANSKRALDLAPDLAEAHAAKGVALDTSGRFEEATVEFEEALKLDPDSFDTHFFYGRTCLSRGLHEQAIRLFERAAELQPKDYRSLCFAAMEYLKLERHTEARAATQRCLERVQTEIKARPDNAPALCFGAWALACTGQKARAEALAAQAAVIDPDDCFMQYNIACIYSVLGRIDAAIDHLDHTLTRTTASTARWYVEWIKQDADFDQLRKHKRFQTLLARLEAQASQQTP